jgi:predicted CXXCH cytochrome family protein
MATELAAVVARDLPAQPTWARQVGPAPVLSWDTDFCGGCHATEYAAWKGSVHAHAGEDPMMLFCRGTEQRIEGQPFGRLCVGCHDPVGARTGDFTFQSKRGVTCIGCHDVELPLQAGGNGDLQAAAHADWTADHKARALASLTRLRQPSFCAGCHQQFVPGSGLLAISTIREYETGPFAGQTLCVDCHMPKTDGVADHRAAGGNVYMGHAFGDDQVVSEQTAHLKGVLSVTAVRVAGGVLVTMRNVGAGHDFPTGVTDIRQAWVQVEAKDPSGAVTVYGGRSPSTGLLPLDAPRLGIDIATPDGTLLLEHELSQATRLPFDTRIPAGESQALFVPVGALPDGATMEAVVDFGVVRDTYYRAALDAGAPVLGDAGTAPPTIEMARVPVR